MVKAAQHSGIFTFELSNPVGLGQPNLDEDVEFVRFGLACIRISIMKSGVVTSPKYADFLKAARDLPAFGPCDSALVEIIRLFQKAHDLKVDGLVSVSPTGSRAPSGRFYVHAHLESNMFRVYPNIYPRIDQCLESGPAISRAVKRIFRTDLRHLIS